MTEIYRSGTLIGNRYVVVQGPHEKPGLAGGMGIVYLCEDLKEDRPVALKTFRPEYLPDRAARDRFLREGTAWVDLGAHPHIVRCYQVIHLDLEVYLVVELVAKEQGREDASLRSWLAPGHPLPVETALLFALQIARALKHATAVIPGFVHRDLKPENVLVGADRLTGTHVNRLRVTDFGLAAVLQAGDQGTGSREQDTSPSGQGSQVTDPLRRTQLTRGIAGTPLYMAPEQWWGEGVSAATDVYALGCMLYEMVAGQRAVSGDSLAALERAHCAGERRPLPAGLPGEVEEVVTRCLALKPGARYATWEEVEGTLDEAYRAMVGRPAPSVQTAAALSRGERVAVGWSYSAMGASYLDIGKAAVAPKYFERAVGIGQAEGEQRLTGAGLNGLGLAHQDLGEFTVAAREIEQSLHIARDIGDKHLEKIALNNLGTCYRELGRLENAQACYEKALCIAREFDDQAGGVAILSSLGLLHEELGQLDTAIRYHRQYLDTVRRAKDRAGEVGALVNLGICHFLLEQTAEAVRYHQQALDAAHEIGDLRSEGRALAGLGQCYFRTNCEEAMRYLRQALNIARQIDDRQNAAGALGSLAWCLYQSGQMEEAERLARESLEISDEIGNIRTSGGTCLLLVMLMVRKQRFSEALCLAERAAQIFARVGPVPQAQYAQQLAAQVRAMMQ